MLRWLVVINLAGAAYGFNWYRLQLLATPPWLWPVVPDSPLSALLFGLTLIPRLRAIGRGAGADPAATGAGPARAGSGLRCAGDRRSALAALARLATFKYGLWTVVVLGGAALRARSLDAEAALLIATHAGMALEAWLLLRASPPAPGPRRLAIAWLLLNDASDYGPLRTHPRLPDPAAFPYVAAEAVVLTLLAARVARGGRGDRAGCRSGGSAARDGPATDP